MKLKISVKNPHALAHGEQVTSLEITEEDGAFYLIRLNAEGRLLADTFHPTLDEAIRQAHHEYSIAPTEWRQAEGQIH